MIHAVVPFCADRSFHETASNSGFLFSVYIGQVTNAGEWKEMMLDYCHHKRTYYTPHFMDKIARVVKGVLKIAPK